MTFKKIEKTGASLIILKNWIQIPGTGRFDTGHTRNSKLLEEQLGPCEISPSKLNRTTHPCSG